MLKSTNLCERVLHLARRRGALHRGLLVPDARVPDLRQLSLEVHGREHDSGRERQVKQHAHALHQHRRVGPGAAARERRVLRLRRDFTRAFPRRVIGLLARDASVAAGGRV